jgi:hypothetical protein
VAVPVQGNNSITVRCFDASGVRIGLFALPTCDYPTESEDLPLIRAKHLSPRAAAEKAPTSAQHSFHSAHSRQPLPSCPPPQSRQARSWPVLAPPLGAMEATGVPLPISGQHEAPFCASGTYFCCCSVYWQRGCLAAGSTRRWLASPRYRRVLSNPTQEGVLIVSGVLPCTAYF